MSIERAAAWVTVVGTVALVVLTVYQIRQLERLRA